MNSNDNNGNDNDYNGNIEGNNDQYDNDHDGVVTGYNDRSKTVQSAMQISDAQKQPLRFYF